MSLGITQLKAGASRNGALLGGVVKESFPKTNLLIFFSPCWRGNGPNQLLDDQFRNSY